MPRQDDGVHNPKARGALRASAPAPLQADHQARPSPYNKGGRQSRIPQPLALFQPTQKSIQSNPMSHHIINTSIIFVSLMDPGVQHGAKGDLHVEVDQPAPGEEADPAEVVHKEEAGGANLSHMVEECQHIIINDFQTDSKLWSSFS